MRKTMVWTLGIVGGAGLILLFCIATRWRELFWSETCEGTVAQIQPSEKTEGELPKSYLVELRTDDLELHVFSSTDWRWSLVSRGDRVQARLLPMLPWSKSKGRWQDGVLVSKFLRHPTLADSDLLQVRLNPGLVQGRPDSRAIQVPLPRRDKKKNLGGLGNLVISLAMFCYLWRRQNATTTKAQAIFRASQNGPESLAVPVETKTPPTLGAGVTCAAGGGLVRHSPTADGRRAAHVNKLTCTGDCGSLRGLSADKNHVAGRSAVLRSTRLSFSKPDCLRGIPSGTRRLLREQRLHHRSRSSSKPFEPFLHFLRRYPLSPNSTASSVQPRCRRRPTAESCPLTMRSMAK